jgi:hypothetical protein
MRMPLQQLPPLAAEVPVKAEAKGGKEAKASPEESKGLDRSQWLEAIFYKPGERQSIDRDASDEAEEEEQQQEDELVAQRLEAVADKGDPAAADSEGARLLLAESERKSPDAARMADAHTVALTAPAVVAEEDFASVEKNFNDINSARLIRTLVAFNNARNTAKYNGHELTMDPTLDLFKVCTVVAACSLACSASNILSCSLLPGGPHSAL